MRMLILLLVLFPLTQQYKFLSDYGEPCDNYTECRDHRMFCNNEKDNRTCACVKYHEWKGVQYGCVQMYDGEQIMRWELRFNNMSKEIEEAQDIIFGVQLWARTIVIIICGIAVFSVMVFCIYGRMLNAIVRRDLNELQTKTRTNTFLKQKSVEGWHNV